MKICQYDFVEGAKQAEGIAVIIDVFRAFSVACYCFDNGVEKIIPVASAEQALAVEGQGMPILRIGERNGRKLAGFDFGNSPTEIQSVDFGGKCVVQTTHAGTQGLVNANKASDVLTGALVNAKATADYIRRKKPPVVSLVRMGLEASSSTDEDDLCAAYIESLLLGRQFDHAGIRQRLLQSPCAERFLDPAIPWNPMSDFDCCTEVNAFNFVLKLKQEAAGLAYLDRIFP